MAPGHHLGDLAPPGGERQLLAASDLHVSVPGHSMDRLGHGGRGDRHVLCQPRADHGVAAAGKGVDRGEIVLDGRRRVLRGGARSFGCGSVSVLSTPYKTRTRVRPDIVTPT